jgi:hypothetical protein
MGGVIGVTIRYSDSSEWRGSCWTNVLPVGLFGADFYDEATSEEHVKSWQTNLVKHRKADKSGDLEKLWGGHHMLAPLEYGIIVIDFRTKQVISAQGYSAVQFRLPSDIMDPEYAYQFRKDLKLPFDRSKLNPDWQRFDAWTQHGHGAWATFGPHTFWRFDETLEYPTEFTKAKIMGLGFELSVAEKRAWAKFIRERSQ